MTLEELITTLEAADPTLVVPHGFTNPHSYRGYYDELAFEPATNVTVVDMLADAQFALGCTYTGWKGGAYTMQGFTDCWLAEQGCLGETLGALLLSLMLAAGVRDAARQTTGQDACACTHPQDRHLSACTECPCIGYAPTWPPTKRRIVPACDQCGAPWATGHTCAAPAVNPACTNCNGTGGGQPDACIPVQADGTIILVRSNGDWTDKDHKHMAAVVQAAERAHDAAPKCPNCGHLWQHHGEDVCGVRSRRQGVAYNCGCTDAEEDHAPAVGQPAEAHDTDRAAVLQALADWGITTGKGSRPLADHILRTLDRSPALRCVSSHCVEGDHILDLGPADDAVEDER
ncbi:hypothetical protein [Streptomyces sp. NPDC057677]|uniref:hypothetical protein n=1 Tax=unclassified Streptomyces TaxID=2593676 RepID=UPI003677D04C